MEPGLTNMIYSEDAYLIEIVGKKKIHALYAKLSYVLKHDYTRIQGENVEENIEVELGEIEEAITE